MKLLRPVALILALCALSAPALAGTGTPLPYSQLRQQFPQINDAIAAATESDLHGTFNRLSAIWNRAPIDTAPVDAGLNGQLPANFLRNLDATLLDLQEDLRKDQVGGLTVAQKLTLLQVVRIYAFRRTIELWQSEDFTYCPAPSSPEDPPCVDNDPAVFNWLDSTATAGRTLYSAVYNSIPSGDRGSLVTPSSLDGENFIDNIETAVIIKGAESIDD